MVGIVCPVVSLLKMSWEDWLFRGNILLLEDAFFREVKEALTTNEYWEQWDSGI